MIVDLHALLWHATSPESLSPRARKTLESPGSRRLVWSAACTWELSIKVAKGKLRLPQPVADYVGERVVLLGMESLAISDAHAALAGALPRHHSDPFDRMLVAQSIVEGFPILTSDPEISRYAVDVVW